MSVSTHPPSSNHRQGLLVSPNVGALSDLLSPRTNAQSSPSPKQIAHYSTKQNDCATVKSQPVKSQPFNSQPSQPVNSQLVNPQPSTMPPITSRVMKTRHLMNDIMEDSIMAMELQQDLGNEGEARKSLQTQAYRNSKCYADKL